MLHSHLVFGVRNIRVEYAILLNRFSTVQAAIEFSSFLTLVASNNMTTRSIYNWFVIIVIRFYHFKRRMVTIQMVTARLLLHHEFSIAQLTF